MTEKKQKKGSAGSARLTPKEEIFAHEYLRTFNATRSHMLAYGSTRTTAEAHAWEVLGRKRVKDYIEKEKKKRFAAMNVQFEDVARQHMSIAFSRLTDFLKIETLPNGKKRIYLDLEGKDTSSISEISVTANGYKIKMADRSKSLEWLQHYLDAGTEAENVNVVMMPEATDGD